jgi:diketogulonate reductase-like aldo/keto reductase
MEEALHAGKIKSIGVSNFLPHHIEPLLKTAEISPAVNQIECHIGMYRGETVNYCSQKGILLEAWAPLNRGAALENELIVKIGEKHGKTSAQVHLRWCLQHGIIPLPKSVTPSRIAENADVFDFTISDEDMAAIDAMEYFGGSGFDPDNVDF